LTKKYKPSKGLVENPLEGFYMGIFQKMQKLLNFKLQKLGWGTGLVRKIKTIEY
jgi:hypothetical protein